MAGWCSDTLDGAASPAVRGTVVSMDAAPSLVRRTYFVRGRVQGVGFRWWTRSRALELGVVGHARNMDDGRVEVVAQGSPDAVERLGALLAPAAAGVDGRPGRVDSCAFVEGSPRDGVEGFRER